MMTAQTKPKRIDYWKLIDRVNCSGKVNGTALRVLVRLLQHRHTKHEKCYPGIKLLAKRLYPGENQVTAYNNIQRALRDLSDNGIIRIHPRKNKSSFYEFNFLWGTEADPHGAVNVELTDVGEVVVMDDRAAVIARREGKSPKKAKEEVDLNNQVTLEKSSRPDLNKQVTPREYSSQGDLKNHHHEMIKGNDKTNDKEKCSASSSNTSISDAARSFIGPDEDIDEVMKYLQNEYGA